MTEPKTCVPSQQHINPSTILHEHGEGCAGEETTSFTIKNPFSKLALFFIQTFIPPKVKKKLCKTNLLQHSGHHFFQVSCVGKRMLQI